MQTVKKPIALLLAAAMLLSTAAYSAHGVNLNLTFSDIYSVSPDTEVIDIYAVDPDTEPFDVYAVAPDTEPSDVYTVAPDTDPSDDYVEEPDVGFYVDENLGPFIYICDDEGVTYDDAEGNPVSFGSLHEAIHGVQNVTPAIVVQDNLQDGNIPGAADPQTYHIADQNGDLYMLNEVVLEYTALTDAVTAARQIGNNMVVVRAGEVETAAFYVVDPFDRVAELTAGDLTGALAAVPEYSYDTIVLNGTVLYGQDYVCSTCQSGQIAITKDLTIVAYPGSTATVTWSGSGDRTLWVGEGVTLTLGSEAGDSGTLVFDGGAQWPDDYAWFEYVLNGRYLGRQHTTPLITLEHSAQSSVGNTLIVGETVTIQNYIDCYNPGGMSSLTGYGVIQIKTADSEWTAAYAPEEAPAVVHLHGKMLNNAAKQGGAIYMQGGELYIYDGAVLSGNSADIGGAVLCGSDEQDLSMPATIVMYGGEMSHNSAFSGGAVALYTITVKNSSTMSSNPDAPPCTFTMYGGSLSYNVAHGWVMSGNWDALSLLIYGEGGGGAVVLSASNAAFNMMGGEITWNRTLPLSQENEGTVMEYQEEGHAIMSSGSLMGTQQVNISGGTIANNGVDPYTGTVTGTAIEIRQELSIYKVLLLSSFSEMLENGQLSGFEGSTELYQELVVMMGSEDTNLLEMMDLVNSYPMEEFYDTLFEIKDYVDENVEMTDAEKAEFDQTYATLTELKKEGICDSGLGMVVSGTPTLGENQTVGLGADVYIRLEKETPNFTPEIIVSPYATPGDIAVEYGENYDGNIDDPPFTPSSEGVLLIQDAETGIWYVHDPNAVYTVTYRVGSKTYTETASATADSLPVVTLLSTAQVVENGWITKEQAAFGFKWYYEEHGEQIECADGEHIVLSKDMTFIGVVDATATVTVYHNNGTEDFESWYKLPLFNQIEPTVVADLYSRLTPPVDPENPEVTVPRNVIAAGLTKVQVPVIVDGTYSLDEYLFHTVWAIDDGTTSAIQAKVNPYYVDEESVLYVLWAYDEDENDIPDFLEVTLTIDPNEGTFSGSSEKYPVEAALGTVLSSVYIEGLMSSFRHSGVEGGIGYETQVETNEETGETTSIVVPVAVPVPVLLVGLTTDADDAETEDVNEGVVGRIYHNGEMDTDSSDKEHLAGLQNVFYAGSVKESYVVTKDETFYAIWSYDACENTLGIPVNPDGGSDGVADVLEAVLTLHPNGGKIVLGETPEGDLEYTTKPFSMWAPVGERIPAEYLMGIQEMIVHDNVDVSYAGNEFSSPVRVVGLTATEPDAAADFTPGRIYSVFDEDKAAFAKLANFINTWQPTEDLVITGDMTYYAVWSYDMDGQGYPDVFDALLVLDPNGGVIINGTDSSGNPICSEDPFMVLFPIGTIISADMMSSIFTMFAYPNSSHVLVGTTMDPAAAEQRVYGVEDRNLFNNLKGIASVSGANDPYKVTGNTNIYAVWSKNIDGDSEPDVYQLAITLDANGGTIMDTEAATFMYPIPVPDPETEGTQITYEVMMEMSSAILTAPEGLVLYGLAFDSAGTQPITETFFMAEDTTIYAIWSDEANLRIHHNNGTNGVKSLTLSAQVLDSDYVADLYQHMTAPDGGDKRKVIAAGLTTEPVSVIADTDYKLPDGVELYHSVWAIGLDQDPAAVNPYTMKGVDDLYVLWAYDQDGNNIPDFLEVQLKLQINAEHGLNAGSMGTLTLGETDENENPIEYNYWVYVVTAKGTVVPGAFFEQVMSGLSHSGIEGTPVLPVGVTRDQTVNEKLPYKATAEDKKALAALGEILYKGKVPADYTFEASDDTTFYAVWAKDTNSNDTADIFEYVAVTLDPNGGTLTIGTAGTLTEPVTQLKNLGTEVTLSTMHMGTFAHDPVNEVPVYLVGFTTDPEAKDRIYTGDDRELLVYLKDFVAVGDRVTLNEDSVFYAVWGYNEDVSDVADVLEWLVIILNANGGAIRDPETVDLSKVDEDYLAYVEDMIRNGRAMNDEEFAYAIRPSNGEEGPLYVYMTYSIMEMVCNALLEPPAGRELIGMARRDRDGNNVEELEKGQNFQIYKDTVLYPIWSDPVTSVTIEWGDLTFNYVEGEWSTETHTYGEATIDPCTENGNWISITNGTAESVIVSVTYEAADGYQGIKGLFTLTDPYPVGTLVESIETTVPAGKECRVWVWLSGSLGGPEAGSYTCGRCIVTISNGTG